ncbi:MAG: hypothetical protein M1818_001900 [Claussenomyces sp. TS43310]|nr:MAG: hypothetical protein M1818_001900 [Claussenomyces sp. TS43310]
MPSELQPHTVISTKSIVKPYTSRRTVLVYITCGSPAAGALADNIPTSTPFTSDDPSTPTSLTPPFSISTTAPDPNDIPDRQQPNTAIEDPYNAGLDNIPGGPEVALEAHVSRRRRRTNSSSSGEAAEAQYITGAGTDLPYSSSEHRRKRRRHQLPMMRSEGESSNTNGALTSFSNGSGVSTLHKAAMSNTKNGTSKISASINGSTHMNGRSEDSPAAYFGHDREEVTRILLQTLTDMGYTGSAEILSKESGFELESPSVAAFRNAVLQGEWAKAEDLLFGSNGASTEGGVSILGNGLVLAEGADKDLMRFWLRQQKFLELLEQRDTGRALMVLRSELTPLYQDVGKLHFLSSLLVCKSTDDLKSKAEWDGAHGQSRQYLLAELSRCIAPSVMIPEHRLAVLLQQVKQAQISACIYHYTEASPSLYADHQCDRNNFPLRVVHELDTHSGEVWNIIFSHDGAWLATCGSDGKAIIYEVASWKVVHILADHEAGICSLAWSPDDSLVVTSSMDRKARLWDTHTGELLHALSRFEEPVSSCVWAPDGRSFVTGSLSKDHNLCQWNIDGELIYDWGRMHRITDLAVSSDGHRLVAMDRTNHIHVYNFVTRELEYEMDLKVELSSVNISHDSRQMLVSKVDGEARLFDIVTRETVKIFAGQKGGKFMIRSAFGGANESFVISGSEDGHVFIWHKETGALIERLDAHKPGPCNAVSWNPSNPCMFATAGDDMKVRIWSNETSERPVSGKEVLTPVDFQGTDSNDWRLMD